MRLSALADYAVVLMSTAARHCGSVASAEDGTGKRARTSAAQLSQETGIPLATAQKLVHALVRARLLRSIRGQGGGVQLARPAAAITIADVIEAVEGPIALTACVDSGRQECGLEGSCHMQPHWPVVNTAVRSALAGITLTTLVHAQ